MGGDPSARATGLVPGVRMPSVHKSLLGLGAALVLLGVFLLYARLPPASAKVAAAMSLLLAGALLALLSLPYRPEKTTHPPTTLPLLVTVEEEVKLKMLAELTIDQLAGLGRTLDLNTPQQAARLEQLAGPMYDSLLALYAREATRNGGRHSQEAAQPVTSEPATRIAPPPLSPIYDSLPVPVPVAIRMPPVPTNSSEVAWDSDQL
jgi:multisubunit Na+/H+ antiporter MnhC subunit